MYYIKGNPSFFTKLHRYLKVILVDSKLYFDLVATNRASIPVFVGRQGVELFFTQKQEGVDPFQGLIFGIGGLASGTGDEEVPP